MVTVPRTSEIKVLVFRRLLLCFILFDVGKKNGIQLTFHTLHGESSQNVWYQCLASYFSVFNSVRWWQGLLTNNWSECDLCPKNSQNKAINGCFCFVVFFGWVCCFCLFWFMIIVCVCVCVCVCVWWRERERECECGGWVRGVKGR